ncbi:MAG: hypothetical protein GWO87_00560 [Xanthomonadaceae bacterium]|nr:hypothetical protein [Rhodospirillaceae bacterium]NIA17672.1 hypothetical protein [Xanthomonadaceae bacterium]
MLEQLFNSKIRVKLLRLFLANPNKRYYIRQLTRLFDSQINSVRREINNLVSIGILNFVSDSKQDEEKKDAIKKGKSQRKYFQANINFDLYPELKSLILRSHLVIKEGICKEIAKAGNINYLVFTGIFVDFPNSPIDILIVGRANKVKISKIINKFEKELNRNINYTLMSKTEFLYRKDIADRFLYNILENKKIVVIDKITL